MAALKPDVASLFRLDHEVAVVTGAGAGIGKSTAMMLADAGARIVAVDRDPAASQAVAEEIRQSGGEAVAFEANVAERSASEAIIDFTIDTFGSIDILVNNAGIYPPGERLPDLDWPLFESTYQVNVFAPLHLISEAAKRMQSGGRIINMSSMESLRPSGPSTIHYTSSKAALNGITRAAAVDLAPLGIRVNAILPGVVRTEGTAMLPDEFLEGFAARAPSGRVGDPQDIAGAALFLASKASAYVNGHCLVVDGGTTISG